MRNPLKFAGVPQTTGPISATSGAKFTIFWGHVEEILLLNNFFLIIDMCLSCEDIARQSCAMVPRWWFLAPFLHPVFSMRHVQHISDLHSKFTLGPHHVSKYGRHPISDRWDKARKKRQKKIETTGWKYNGLPYSIGGHNKKLSCRRETARCLGHTLRETDGRTDRRMDRKP